MQVHTDQCVKHTWRMHWRIRCQTNITNWRCHSMYAMTSNLNSRNITTGSIQHTYRNILILMYLMGDKIDIFNDLISWLILHFAKKAEKTYAGNNACSIDTSHLLTHKSHLSMTDTNGLDRHDHDISITNLEIILQTNPKNHTHNKTGQ